MIGFRLCAYRFKLHLMNAYVFPGQGAQFTGMGKDLYESNAQVKALFDRANQILGFQITDIMFGGTVDELKQTNVTQPAIFLHSVAAAISNPGFAPEMVAGHSLGEFSSLVANKALSFEDGLRLVAKRAQAMQRACEINPSTMAAIVGLDDKVVEEICATIKDEIVVAANYNCPGQLVISGSIKGVNIACEKLKAAGAKRALLLQVGGAFHSPLMEPAREELAKAIEATPLQCSWMPGLSKCRCASINGCFCHKRESHFTAYLSGTLDTICAKHGKRWSNNIYRVWTRQGATGAREEDCTAGRGQEFVIIQSRLSCHLKESIGVFEKIYR